MTSAGSQKPIFNLCVAALRWVNKMVPWKFTKPVDVYSWDFGMHKKKCVSRFDQSYVQTMYQLRPAFSHLISFNFQSPIHVTQPSSAPAHPCVEWDRV
jgi:hypothetical protein